MVRSLDDAEDELQRLAEVWAPLEAEITVAEEGLLDAQAGLDDSEKVLERALKRLVVTTKRTGDAALLARLEEAASSTAREQEQLTELDADLAVGGDEAARLTQAMEAAAGRQAETKQAARQATDARKEAEKGQQRAAALTECADRAAALATIEDQLEPVARWLQVVPVCGEGRHQARPPRRACAPRIRRRFGRSTARARLR